MTFSFFSCSRSALLYSIIIIGAFFIFGQIGVTHAATPVPPTLQSPANTWTTALTTNNVTLTWSYPTLDPSIWFYLYILKWDSATLTWKPYLAKYVGVTTQDRETFTDGFYAWQLAAVDITQASNPWYQWANDWSKLKVGAGATPTPAPTLTPTPTPAPTGPTPTPCATCPTYYIAPPPLGNDSNPGTSSSAPLKSFSVAIPKLQPGYILILLDGTYTKTTTGLPNINCSTTGGNAKNGTDDAHRITIKAQNERKAYLKSDGSQDPLLMVNCSYWNVEGLYATNASLAGIQGGVQGGIMYFNQVSYINIRKNLLAYSNRFFNDVGLGVRYGHHILIEDNEVYYSFRWMVEAINSYHIIARRNYTNSRNYAPLTCKKSTQNSQYYCTDGTLANPPLCDSHIWCINPNNNYGTEPLPVGAGWCTNNDQISDYSCMNDSSARRMQGKYGGSDAGTGFYGLGNNPGDPYASYLERL